MLIIVECTPPIIKLLPNASLRAPAEFSRSEGFYILSDIQVKCNTPLGIIPEWTLYSCNNSCSGKVYVDLPIKTTFSDLFIPARTLSYGNYELKLKVTTMALSVVMATASTYITITHSTIRVRLVQSGTSVITRNYRENFTLDPGTFSENSDETSFNASVSISLVVKCFTESHFLIRTGIIPITVQKQVC